MRSFMWREVLWLVRRGPVLIGLAEVGENRGTGWAACSIHCTFLGGHYPRGMTGRIGRFYLRLVC